MLRNKVPDLCNHRAGGFFAVGGIQFAVGVSKPIGRMRAFSAEDRRTLATTVRKTIFVVDDDPSMRLALKRRLNQHGFKTEVFDSVEDFHKRADVGRSDCLVLDIKLKDGSGIDLRRELASAGISVPVIFITAIDSDSNRKAATAAGCVAFLTKPFSGKSLIDAINKAADSKRAPNRSSA